MRLALAALSQLNGRISLPISSSATALTRTTNLGLAYLIASLLHSMLVVLEC